MTTIVGFKTEGDNPAVVLASDVTRTHQFLEDKGFGFIRGSTQHPVEKIRYNSETGIMVTQSGCFDDNVAQYMDKLLRGAIDIDRSVKKGAKEFREMHLRRQNGMTWDPSLESYLFVAHNDKSDGGCEPRLHWFFPLGDVREINDFETMGSGSKHARKYVEVMRSQLGKSAGLVDVVGMARGAINYASQDPNTGGFDVALLTRNGLYPAHEIIGDAYKHAEEQITTDLKGLAEKAIGKKREQ